MKDNHTPLSFGEKIRQIRVNKGLLQEDLAKAINASKMFVSRLERGQAEYDDHMLANIREFYNIQNAPLFDHEIEDYRGRLWVWNDLVDANNLHDAKEMQRVMSPILELPFERDLILLYLMIETRIFFKEDDNIAAKEKLKTAEVLLDAASTEALHLYHRNMGFMFSYVADVVDYKASLWHYLQCRNHATGNFSSDSSTLMSIGRLCVYLGKPWQAIVHLEQAQKEYRLGRTNVLAPTINAFLALSYRLVGELNKSEQLCNDALKQAKSINDDYTTGMILLYLSEINRDRGAYKKALELCDQALVLYKNIPYYTQMLISKAYTLACMKDYTQFKDVITQCKELAKDDKNATLYANAINHISTLDSNESTDYLEKIAIPHFRTNTDLVNGHIYLAVELCNILEAHYRKKRKIKKANEIAVVGRDIFKEIYFGGVDFE